MTTRPLSRHHAPRHQGTARAFSTPTTSCKAVRRCGWPPTSAAALLLDAPPLDTDTGQDRRGRRRRRRRASEGTAALVTYGAAPALLIGSDTQSVMRSARGTGDNAYGLIAKGGVTANGVYDGVAATAIQIGGNAGQTTTLAGGARLDSTVTATALRSQRDRLPGQGRRDRSPPSGTRANLGLQHLGRPVRRPRRRHRRRLDGHTPLRNAGSIASDHGRRKGQRLRRDRQLRQPDHDREHRTRSRPRSSRPTTPTTRTTPTHLARQRSGHRQGDRHRRQQEHHRRAPDPERRQRRRRRQGRHRRRADADGDGVDDADEPVDPGRPSTSARRADTFNVQNGIVIGDASPSGPERRHLEHQRRRRAVLGAPARSGRPAGDQYRQGLAGPDQRRDHQRQQPEPRPRTASWLFTADPTAGNGQHPPWWSPARSTSRPARNWACASTSLLTAPTSYTVITGGTLTAGTINQDLAGRHAAYLYVATSRVDTNNVYLDVRQRTASEIGMNKAQTSAYDATFAALSKDKDIAAAYLAQSTKDGLSGPLRPDDARPGRRLLRRHAGRHPRDLDRDGLPARSGRPLRARQPVGPGDPSPWCGATPTRAWVRTPRPSASSAATRPWATPAARWA